MKSRWISCFVLGSVGGNLFLQLLSEMKEMENFQKTEKTGLGDEYATWDMSCKSKHGVAKDSHLFNSAFFPD